jgi:hypothetical protein
MREGRRDIGHGAPLLPSQALTATASGLDGQPGSVLEVAGHDHDEVDHRPDPETAQREELQNPGSDLPGVEPVNPECSQEEAKQNRGYEVPCALEGAPAMALLVASIFELPPVLGLDFSFELLSRISFWFGFLVRMAQPDLLAELNF